MIYRKNVPDWERWTRVVAGILIAICGLYFLRLTIGGYLIAATGAFTVLTGFAGFCPMCYVGGRRLSSKS